MGEQITKSLFKRTALSALLILSVVAAFLPVSSARLNQTIPVIKRESCRYDPVAARLTIKGESFQPAATVTLSNDAGQVAHGRVKIKGARKIIINNVAEADVASGVDVKIINPDGGASELVRLELAVSDERRLGLSDVKRVIAQAVSHAESIGFKATVAVTDREGNVVGVFKMTGARGDTVVGTGRACAPDCGLEGARVPSSFAAISKAGTGAFLSSQGHAFSTRTASFIVQEHFPPRVDFTPGGPLFGVQFSQLPCSDINPRLPLGLSADPGGVPLYKNGLLVGGVGVEGDGRYGLDPDPTDKDTPAEEEVAVAASRGFDPPADIRGEQIIVNGIRFPFVNASASARASLPQFDQLGGAVDTQFPLRSAVASRFRAVTVDGVAGRVDDRFFPFTAGAGLTAGEVQKIIIQAARQAFITRAAIRRPLGSAAEVNISVVDSNGRVLGLFSTPDAPIFGFDVAVQKARTAAFFTSTTAASRLRSAEGGKFARYVEAAARDGIKLDGTVAFSDRAQGFLSRPFFPDGIDTSDHGPFSVDASNFSPFNDGL
ncbi:MAG TPA: heme-binding protein, partial [Blastocatellia bacterium]|nr:heme-binding protein [Blastocatellia bacterium]